MQGQATNTGSSIRILRKQAGMTLAELAVDAGTAISYLSRVETGKSVPTNAFVAQVTRAIADRLAA
jgi:transcriptional regulator with XRE-family HTH domain